MAEIEAEAGEKKKAYDIKIQIAQIQAAKEQAKINKELKMKEMELQAQQAQASHATTPPPSNKDAKSPKVPSSIDEKDELDSYLVHFESYAEKDTSAIKLNVLLTARAMDTGCKGIIVDRALVPDVMVMPGSSGSLQMVDHTLIDSKCLLGFPVLQRTLRVMCVSSPVYPVIIGNVPGARRMLPDPDWKAADQPGVRSTTKVDNKDKDNDDDQGGDIPAWMFKSNQEKNDKNSAKKRDSIRKPAQPKESDDRTRWNVKVKDGATESKCVAGSVVTRAEAKKSDKVYPLKVKEAMSSADDDESAVKNLQKDTTLKKCFDRIGKEILRENYVEKFYKKNGLLYRKHQEIKF